MLASRYGSTNNIVLAVAVIISASWAWSSVGVMQRNYDLQGQIIQKERQAELSRLQITLLEYQRDYHQSTEFQELAARRDLGLVDPGENVLILPEYKAAGKQSSQAEADLAARQKPIEQPTNFEQWKGFLLGRNREGLQGDS